MIRHLLLVDGEASTRGVLRLCFGRFCHLTYATTASEARTVLDRTRVNLVLLEARLPDRPGLELLTEVRALYPRLPIIVVTAFGSERICAEAFRRGASDYFMKPLAPSDLRILEERALASDGLSDPAIAGSHPCAARVLQAVRHLEQHLEESPSLPIVARAVGMGQFTLSRAFRSVMGTSFRTYLRQLRVAKGRQLLGNLHYSVTEVAQLVGYSDLAHFDKVFRKLTGLSPTAYRRRAAG